jgi:hypothetical protein
LEVKAVIDLGGIHGLRRNHGSDGKEGEKEESCSMIGKPERFGLKLR